MLKNQDCAKIFKFIKIVILLKLMNLKFPIKLQELLYFCNHGSKLKGFNKYKFEVFNKNHYLLIKILINTVTYFLLKYSPFLSPTLHQLS